MRMYKYPLAFEPWDVYLWRSSYDTFEEWVESMTISKWKCPRCSRWVREEQDRVCKMCREGIKEIHKGIVTDYAS